MDKNMKALIIGGNGFIGCNLTKYLQSKEWEVTAVDLKKCPYGFRAIKEVIADIRNISNVPWNDYGRIYQVAADMGGAGFVFTGENDADILSNSLDINLHLLNKLKKADYQGRVFYSSSVCVYPDGVEGKESDAYPANPPSNYGWEKLTSERLYLAYAKNYGLDVRIARFHNTFGPYGTYEGGREKSPAAIIRKVIQADKEMEIWGDGNQVRPFIFIDDLLEGIEALMNSDLKEPVNLGPSGGVTINKLADLVCEIAGKWPMRKYIEGPTGERIRHANNDLARNRLKWGPTESLKESLAITYEWIKSRLSV
jgi:nucleoside-diphosphate-sugar epimerase